MTGKNRERKTDEELLRDLRSVLASKGRLTQRIIDARPHVITSTKITDRFGSVCQAYELIGYDRKNHGRKTDEQMLNDLRSLLATKGRLTDRIIDAEHGSIRSGQLKYRFGSVRRAYDLIGYDWRNRKYESFRSMGCK